MPEVIYVRSCYNSPEWGDKMPVMKKKPSLLIYCIRVDWLSSWVYMNGVEAKWVLQFYIQFNLIYFATLSFVYTKCVRLSWSGQQQTCMQSFRCAGDSLLGYFTYRDDGLLNHLFHSTMYFVVLLNGFVVSLHFKPFGLNYSDTNILLKCQTTLHCHTVHVFLCEAILSSWFESYLTVSSISWQDQ